METLLQSDYSNHPDAARARAPVPPAPVPPHPRDAAYGGANMETLLQSIYSNHPDLNVGPDSLSAIEYGSDDIGPIDLPYTMYMRRKKRELYRQRSYIDENQM
jgi:hypothetical protein